MNLTRPIESQLEMARDLACEMTTCADALDLEQKLSLYWSARQIVTCARLYLTDLQLLMPKDQSSTYTAELDALEEDLIAIREETGF